MIIQYDLLRRSMETFFKYTKQNSLPGVKSAQKTAEPII